MRNALLALLLLASPAAASAAGPKTDAQHFDLVCTGTESFEVRGELPKVTLLKQHLSLDLDKKLVFRSWQDGRSGSYDIKDVTAAQIVLQRDSTINRFSGDFDEQYSDSLSTVKRNAHCIKAPFSGTQRTAF